MKASPMPAPPDGFAACRVHDGRQSLLADGAKRQVTHLVALDAHGNNGGRPTVCGLTRFDRGERRADLPGWSMGGGVSGPGIEQERCAACWTEATGDDRSRVVVTWTVEYEVDWLPTTEDEKDYAVEILMDQVPHEVTFHDGGECRRDWTPVGWMVTSEATGDMQMGTLMSRAGQTGGEVNDEHS